MRSHVATTFSFAAILVLLAGLTVGFPPAAKAATALDEVVVSASRLPTSLGEVPVRVEVITGEEIKNSDAKNLTDILEQKLPTHFHKYPGALSSVDIRGFRTDTHGSDIKSRVLILIDGHRAGTGNLAAIPVDNVERIEIVRGPASVVYGSAAMGGVINIITKKGKGRPMISAFAGYGSWNQVEGGVSGSGGFLDNRIGISFSGRTFRRNDDYDSGADVTVDNTEYHDEAYSVSLTATPVEGHTITLVGQYFRAWDVGTPGPEYSSDPDDNKHILRRYGSLTYDGRMPDSEISWNLTGYSTLTRDAWKDPAGMWGYIASVTETETSGLSGSIQFPTFSWGRLLIGGSWDHIRVNSWKDPAGAPWNPDTSYDNYAAFVEEKISGERFSILLGLRYDYFDESIEKTSELIVDPDDESFDHLSVRAGLTYYVTDWLSARAAVGTGFRAPTADELAGHYETAYSKLIGNPDLDQETSTTYEVGLDVDTGSFRGGLGVFYTDYSDRIVGGFGTCVDGDCSWTTYKNVDGATLAAVEGYLSYVWETRLGSRALRVKPFADAIYYLKRDIEDDDYSDSLETDTVPYISRSNLVAGVTLDWEKIADLTFTARYHGKQKVQDWDYSSPNYGKAVDKGGFTVYSIRINFHPLPHLTPYLSIDNLTNKEYAYVLDYPMPGLTVMAGIRAQF